MKVKVGILMGSESDWPTMRYAADVLKRLEVPYEAKVLSAHRTPRQTLAYAETAIERGIKVIICGAGGAAHLAGVIAANSTLPVLGVPIPSSDLNGLDALLATVQMPGGIPVATLAVGKAGATNAALLATSILATNNPFYESKIKIYRQNKADKILSTELE